MTFARVNPAAAAKSLAAFRIVLGLLMAVELAGTAPSLTELYGTHGFLQANLVEKVTGGGALPLSYAAAHFGFSYDEVLTTIFALQGVFLIFFTLGLFTRVATAGVWLGQTFFMNSSFLSVYGVDRYYHAFIFLCLFLPTSSVWALDSLPEDSPPPSEHGPNALLFLQVVLLITYLHAGISKMGGHDWWSGDAVWRAVNIPEFSQMNLLWLSKYPWVAKLLCWGTLLIETGYIAAVWFQKLRTPWVLAIISLHVGIAAFMGLYLFAFTLILFNAVLFLLPDLIQKRPQTLAVQAGVGAIH